MFLALAVMGVLVQNPKDVAEVQAEPPSVEALVESLIVELGAPSFHVRERASQALRRIGPPALPALERAAESDDPEVRLRARDILADVRMGITEDWPADLAALARSYPNLAQRQRIDAIRTIVAALKVQAVPFLLAAMAEEGQAEGKFALQQLKGIGGEDVPRRVVELLPAPAGRLQAEALAWARAKSGSGIEALMVLDAAGVTGPARNEALEAAVKQLLDLLKQRQHRHVLERARQLARTDTHDARLLYLQAEALVALDKDAQAEALRREALQMGGDKEAPHFAAGEMLLGLGRRSLAALECNRILELPPEDSVYDVNAHLRLGSIYSASGLFGEAAESFQKALDLYMKARAAGVGMAMTGGNEDQLLQRVAALREKARRYPAGEDKTIEDELPDSHINVQIQVTVKDGDVKDLCAALDQCAVRVTMNVEPWGMRLLDLGKVAVSYDVEKQQLLMLLNGAVAGEPVAVKLAGPQARVAVNSLDCSYVYSIDCADGRAVRLARFEKDYTIRFRPGAKVAAYTDVTALINDKAYEWKELLEGVRFDYLPKAFEIVVEGTKQTGKRVTHKFNIRLAEPDIRKIAGTPRPAKAAPASRPKDQPPPPPL